MDKRILLALALVIPTFWSPQVQAAQWERCAIEHGRCYVPYKTSVRYGAHGSYVKKYVSRSVACGNGVFGDPLYGVKKHCDYLKKANVSQNSWRICASENERCHFSGTKKVRYGANGRYSYRVFKKWRQLQQWKLW